MKSKNLTVLKAVGVTAGLNLLLAAVLLVFSRFVREDLGQAILFWVISLSLTLGVCLYGVISFSKRATLWASFSTSDSPPVMPRRMSSRRMNMACSKNFGSGDLTTTTLLLVPLTTFLPSCLGILSICSQFNRLGRALFMPDL